MTTRLLFAALSAFLIIGCDSVPVDGDADVEMDADVDMDASVEEEMDCDGGCWVRRCRELTYASGAATDTLDVGEMRAGAFVPYTDGGQATVVFGFQGGVMIQPVVRVPPEAIGADDCVEITVRNRPDPAYPDAHGELAMFTETRFIDPLRPELLPGFLSATVFDQLGWNSVAELRMILEVEARGVDWVRSAEFALHVVDEDGLDDCDVVPRRSMFGCELAVPEGTVSVDSVGETEGLSCDATVDVTLTLTPDVSVPDGCVELTRTLSVSRGCVESQSLTAGGTLGSVVWTIPLDESCGGQVELGLQVADCPCSS